MKDNQEIAKEYTDWHIKTGGFARDMTLRDHFAGLAMPMLAAEFYSLKQKIEDGTADELISKVAYKFADSMLKERAK
jgi:hypothetical protein